MRNTNATVLSRLVATARYEVLPTASIEQKVVEHARRKHNVQGMTDTIYTYLRAQAQK